MKAEISSPVSMAQARLAAAALAVRAVGEPREPHARRAERRLFKPAAYLPKGVSHIRVFLSVNQAGNGLLAAHSGTQTFVRGR